MNDIFGTSNEHFFCFVNFESREVEFGAEMVKVSEDIRDLQRIDGLLVSVITS